MAVSAMAGVRSRPGVPGVIALPLCKASGKRASAMEIRQVAWTMCENGRHGACFGQYEGNCMGMLVIGVYKRRAYLNVEGGAWG